MGLEAGVTVRGTFEIHRFHQCTGCYTKEVQGSDERISIPIVNLTRYITGRFTTATDSRRQRPCQEDWPCQEDGEG